MDANKKYFIASFIVVLFIGALLLFFKFYLFADKTKLAAPAADLARQKYIEAQNKKIKEFNDIIAPAAKSDSDLDGLTNDEEKKLGTDANNPDTDSDGLLDIDETQIFRSNPLKADTDGDGLRDGAEVRNRTNPLKP